MTDQQPEVNTKRKAPFDTNDPAKRLHTSAEGNDTNSNGDLRDFLRKQYAPRYEDTGSEMGYGTDEGYDTDESIKIPENTNASTKSNDSVQKKPFSTNRIAHNKERILRPLEYARKLDDIAQGVFERSYLMSINGQLPKEAPQIPNLIQTPFTSWSADEKLTLGEFCSREAVSKLYNDIYAGSPALTTETLFGSSTEYALIFIESRNIMHIVAHNIRRMQSTGYCSDIISVLVSDETRSNVAGLVPIKCSTIFDLLRSFESCMEAMIEAMTNESISPGPSFLSWRALESNVTSHCVSILKSLQFTDRGMSKTSILKTTVRLLDISILCYVTAHIPDSTSSKLWCNFPNNIVLADSNNTAFGTTIFFSPRKFLCLDEFLGHSAAWVCQIRKSNKSEIDPSESPLYLSTEAKTFADIWGPMWGCYHLDNPDEITNYRVGNGVILPWKEIEPITNAHDLLPLKQPCKVARDEILCHWMSDLDYENDLERGHTSDRVYLTIDNKLLIGAKKTLHVNAECKRNASTIIDDLKHLGCCKIAGTIQKRRVRVSETVLFQVGGSGIIGGLEMEYKIRERTWKQVIVEDWRNNPYQRNPKILQYRVGVEVSVCTQNARRQKLITILGSSTMLNYLEALSLNWTHLGCKDAFYSTLASPHHTAFLQLWYYNEDWQIDMGNAIGCCLEVLAQTGYFEDGLDTFWMSKKGPQYLVSLNPKSHSWAGFLKDSSHSCSMVVLNDVCLEVNMKGARECAESQLPPEGTTTGKKTTGLCVLETSFVVNPKHCPESIVSHRYRRNDGTPGSYKKRWNTSDAADGDKFEFGDNGRFRVIVALNSTQLLGTWKSSALTRVFAKKGLLNHHQEFRFDEDNDAELKPIDVFFINRPSMLAAFSRGYNDTPQDVQLTLRSGQNLGSSSTHQTTSGHTIASMSGESSRSRG